MTTPPLSDEVPDPKQAKRETITGNGEYRRTVFNYTSWGRYVLIIAGVPYYYIEIKDLTDAIDKLVEDKRN